MKNKEKHIVCYLKNLPINTHIEIINSKSGYVFFNFGISAGADNNKSVATWPANSECNEETIDGICFEKVAEILYTIQHAIDTTGIDLEINIKSSFNDFLISDL